MSIRLAVVMDPIERINFHKDSTLAMLLEAQRRQWTIYYLTATELFLRSGVTWAKVRPLQVADDPTNWFQLGEPELMPLHECNLVLMRKDPPFIMEYIYATYLLELAQAKGCRVINDPRSIRDCNEKLFTTWFPDCMPETLVTASRELVREFLQQHQAIVLKPLGGMGGESVFRVQQDDVNFNVIFDALTQHGQHYVMAQRFIPAVTEGDKRILLINGEPIPYVLARIPAAGDFRGNLAAGARGEVRPISARERAICDRVGPVVRDKGLVFVGLDVIGDYLTEINVTSPTGVREIEKATSIGIARQFFDAVLALA